jgi:hypothetical protein
MTKRILIASILAVLLAGCTSRTEFGECIGIADDKDQRLVYKVSAWNVAMAAIFVETIVVPVVVVANEAVCPVAKK